MNSSASTSSWSHHSRARPNRTPSGPRPISTASSRSSIVSSSSSLTRQPSIDTIREEVLTPHPMLRVPSPEHTTRRFSFVSSTSQFSTYSNAASLPSIESSGLNFDMLSERFDELMRRLECAPEPSQAGLVSHATTSSSKTLSAEKRPATGLVSPVRTRVVSQEALGTRTPRPSSANKHRRTSSMSTTSTLGPETNSEHFTVSAFPQPPTSVPQRPSVSLSPTAPLKARYSLKPSPMSETMNHGSPKHASWTGTLLYFDSTKVTDIKELQPDLEAQHQLEKAQPLTGLVGLRQRHPVLFGCGVYFLPILILAIIALIIYVVARYR